VRTRKCRDLYSRNALEELGGSGSSAAKTQGSKIGASANKQSVAVL